MNIFVRLELFIDIFSLDSILFIKSISILFTIAAERIVKYLSTVSLVIFIIISLVSSLDILLDAILILIPKSEIIFSKPLWSTTSSKDINGISYEALAYVMNEKGDKTPDKRYLDIINKGYEDWGIIY